MGVVSEAATDAGLAELAERGTISGLVLDGLLDPSGLDGEPLDVARCRFARARLIGTEIDGWRLREVEFSECDLSGLVGADLVLDGAMVRGTRLSGCAWVSATVRDATFVEVTAKEFSLRFGRLRRVVFDGCALPGLDLTEAELDHVTFRRCDLTGADFTAARAQHVRLIACDVQDIRGVEGLAGAYVDAGALPTLAPVLAQHVGLRIGSMDDLEALDS